MMMISKEQASACVGEMKKRFGEFIKPESVGGLDGNGLGPPGPSGTDPETYHQPNDPERLFHEGFRLVLGNRTPELRVGDAVHYVGNLATKWGCGATVVNLSPLSDHKGGPFFSIRFDDGLEIVVHESWLERPCLLVSLVLGTPSGCFQAYLADGFTMERGPKPCTRQG
jgi:hypothetical protein